MNRLLRKKIPGDYIVISKNGVRLPDSEFRAKINERREGLLDRLAISIEGKEDVEIDIKPNG